MALPEKLLSDLREDCREFLNHFFQNCPVQTVSLLFRAEYSAGSPLITTDDSCSQVFFLLKGRLQAIEEHTGGMPFRFMEMAPDPVQIIGDFELFTGSARRYITLTVLEPSVLLVLPAGAYLYWIKNDANALFLRICMLMSQMSEQSRHEREYLFLDNRTRLLLYLQDEYRKSGGSDCLIRDTRDETAAKIGCSVRTLNRIIFSLREDGLITIYRGKIKLSARQAEMVAELL